MKQAICGFKKDFGMYFFIVVMGVKKAVVSKKSIEFEPVVDLSLMLL